MTATHACNYFTSKCRLYFPPRMTHMTTMGWLKFVGSIKLQVSFAKEPYKRDSYSAKETYNCKESTNRSHPILLRMTSTTGWLRLVGSWKLQVSFAKGPSKTAFYSAKETYNFKESTNRSHPILTRMTSTTSERRLYIPPGTTTFLLQWRMRRAWRI